MSVRLVLCLLLCGLLGCSGNSRAPIEDRVTQPQPPAAHYTVKRGDTLYSIAFRYGKDFREVAAANGIVAPYTIYPGQRILLEETPYAAAAPAPSAYPAVVTPAATPAPGAGIATAPAPVSPAVPASRSVASPGYPGASPPPAEPATAYAAPPPATVAPEGSLPSASPPPSPPSSPPPVPAQPPATAEQSAVPVPAPTAVPQAGQPPPEAKPTSGEEPFAGEKIAAWRWPTSGPVIRGYSESLHKGIDIGGARGDPVTAVAAGKVVYAGTGIAGFGELLIIKHNDVYLSAYGHNDELLVAEGDTVAVGQTIAQKGSSGTDSVKLHFEIRQEGKPVDPQRLLPRR